MPDDSVALQRMGALGGRFQAVGDGEVGRGVPRLVRREVVEPGRTEIGPALGIYSDRLRFR